MTGLLFHRLLLGVLACGLTVCQAGQHWIGVGQRVVTWAGSLPADRVRLGVRDEGVYRVTAAEIAAAAGVAESAAHAAMETRGLALTCQGRTIAWTTDGDALYFYGVPTAELFAPENVYWLAFGSGAVMEPLVATPDAGSATNAWFMRSESFRSAFVAPYDARDRRSSGATLTNVLNFGEWVPTSSDEVTRSKSRTVTLAGFCDGAETGVVARVSVASYKNKAEFENIYVDNHTCEVWLNGTACGSQSWSNEQAVVFECAMARGVVTNGPVQVKIRNGLSASDISDFLVLDLTLAYPRLYRAQEGALACTGGAAQTVAADGFASPLIRAWDVTAPEAPLELEAAVGPGTNGTWQVAFACGDAGARYAVFDASAGCFGPSVSGVSDTDWSDPAEMPELAIVIPPRRWVSGFDAAVQPLADFRGAQGLRTRVIDAEEIYNAFSGGLVHPEAFRLFSAAGVTNGASQTLRYLLFAGHGGSDYKLEVFRLGEAGPYPALFPLYLFPQTETEAPAALLLPNDPVLGNAVGGAVPEVAVGRFIATTAAELTRMVTKTIRYELTATWKNKAVFAACKQLYVDDPNFSNIVAQTFPGYEAGGWTAKAFYPSPPNSAMNTMWENTYYETGAKYELAEGAGLLYYFGHSSDTLLGTSGTEGNWFRSAATIQSGTWPFAPVAVLMGCRIGRWTLLDMRSLSQCLAEAGVRNPASGFTAVVSASGYLQSGEAVGFSNAFRDRIAAGALRLGDAWCGAFAALGDAAAAKMQHLSLLGDPSLCIRAGVTARGTPSAWLIEQGLTGDPYADLTDQDSDGFPTWQEVQAGTGYLQKRLMIRGLAVGDAAAEGVSLTFEALGGLSHRVLSTTNLASDVWEPLPWRPDAGGAWSLSGIPGDWPVEAVEVPYDESERQRFYMIEAQ